MYTVVVTLKCGHGLKIAITARYITKYLIAKKKSRYNRLQNKMLKGGKKIATIDNFAFSSLMLIPFLFFSSLRIFNSKILWGKNVLKKCISK